MVAGKRTRAEKGRKLRAGGMKRDGEAVLGTHLRDLVQRGGRGKQETRRESGHGHGERFLPLADRAIGNLQQWLIGTHHGVSRGQLPVYLDEFVFRHNRRKHPMAAFQTLLGLGTARNPTPYDKIRGAADLAAN